MREENPFERHALQYDQWFDRHPKTYQLELGAVRELLPANGRGVEVGAGTGRFMGPLGISSGIEPAAAMRSIASERGITLREGIAEDLPLESESVDYLLLVTTLCFVTSTEEALLEAHRVLKPDGSLIIGMIDRNSGLGVKYEQHSGESTFYRGASLLSVDETVELLQQSGFTGFQFRQTLLPERTPEEAAVTEGHGEGGFVAIRALKAERQP